MRELVARASLHINASRNVVWSTLLEPDTIKRMLPAHEVLAPWRDGERFAWTFDMLGRPTLVEGVVRRVERERALEYDYLDPYERDVRKREHAHLVAIALDDDGDGTRISVTQDANLDDVARKHAEGGWRLALNHLKVLVERRT